MDLKACGIGLGSYYMEHGLGVLWDRSAAWSAVSAKLENMIIALGPGHWEDAVGVVLYVQSHSTARGSRPTALQVQQTAPQAIPQAYRFIPQFPSRCQAPSHSSLAPFYITPVSCQSHSIDLQLNPTPHSSPGHPTATGLHCSIAQLPASYKISQFSSQSHIPLLNLVYLYLRRGSQSLTAPLHRKVQTNLQPDDNRIYWQANPTPIAPGSISQFNRSPTSSQSTPYGLPSMDTVLPRGFWSILI